MDTPPPLAIVRPAHTSTKGMEMDMRPLVDVSVTANTGAFATFILAASLKRQGLLDDEAITHLLHLLDQQLELLEPGTDVHAMHQKWRRKIAE